MLAALEGDDVDRVLLDALSDPSKPVRRRAARAALCGWRRVQANEALLARVPPVLEQDAHDRPDDDARWFRLGAAREFVGDLDGAIEAYGRQVVLDRLNPHVPSHLETLRKRREAAR